jgi:hypothetical protein
MAPDALAGVADRLMDELRLMASCLGQAGVVTG